MTARLVHNSSRHGIFEFRDWHGGVIASCYPTTSGTACLIENECLAGAYRACQKRPVPALMRLKKKFS